MNIASSFDFNYAPPFINTIGSFLNTHVETTLKFYLIVDSQRTIDYVQNRTAELFPPNKFSYVIKGKEMSARDINFFSKYDRRDVELRSDIKPIHYSQLLLSRYFEIDKFLYVEPDQIAINPLLSTYETDLSRSIIGAVPVPPKYGDGILFESMGKEFLYFNAGVTLTDAESWRKNEIEEQAKEILIENFHSKTASYRFYTQGILNKIFHNSYTHFDYRINFSYFPFYRFDILYDGNGTFFSSGNADKACTESSILHFNGGRLNEDCPMIKHYKNHDYNKILEIKK